MITNTIQSLITDAMKAQDEVRVATLKLLSAELHNYHIDHPDMTDDDEMQVVKKEAKKRRDAIVAYTKAGAADKAQREQAELTILEDFLPEQMSQEELTKLVDAAIKETGAKEMKDMGKVIGVVMKQVGNKADGGMVAQLIKTKLGK